MVETVIPTWMVLLWLRKNFSITSKEDIMLRNDIWDLLDEFIDSEKSGAARINEMFFLARRKAPCSVFVDEIDATVGGLQFWALSYGGCSMMRGVAKASIVNVRYN